MEGHRRGLGNSACGLCGIGMGHPVCPFIFHAGYDETAGRTCGGETSRCTETSCGEPSQIERENEDGAGTPGFAFSVCEGTGGAVGNIREEEFENTVAASVILGIGIFWGDHFFSGVKMEKTFSRTIPVRLITSDGIQHDLNKGTLKDSLKVGFKNEISEGLQLGTVIQKKEMTERFHEIIVPRCGEYRLVLSDGTRIYLNAESSLRFPDVFGDERKVYLTGEAYFEVTQDSLRPFLVEFEGACVKVLGTQFNVRAYPTGPSFTTLVSGCVKIVHKNQVLQLEPGQQCEVREEKMLLHNADLMTVLAWKNGEFIFKDVALETIMDELARWYDMQVDYETEDLKKMRFYLYVERSENLEEVLQKIALTNQVKYRVNGKKIIIQR